MPKKPPQLATLVRPRLYKAMARGLVSARAPLCRDHRVNLESLLDELMRSLGFERAVVLLYDEDRASLAGGFGIGVEDAIARELVLPLANPDDPIVEVLRVGIPQRISDATTDERI